jgi:hypothetical protein
LKGAAVGERVEPARNQCNIANEDEVSEGLDLVQAVSQVEQKFTKICDDYGRKIRWQVDALDWRSRELAR